MLSDHATDYMTREKWRQALSTYRERDSSPSYAKGRRKHLRFQMVGWATVTVSSADEKGAQAVFSGCEALNVSEEGMALRAPRKIEPDTVVSIELHAGGRTFWLSGRVVHQTRLPGAVKMGIKLEFGPTGEQTRSAGG